VITTRNLIQLVSFAQLVHTLVLASHRAHPALLVLLTKMKIPERLVLGVKSAGTAQQRRLSASTVRQERLI
jgi:hypothetical protein